MVTTSAAEAMNTYHKFPLKEETIIKLEPVIEGKPRYMIEEERKQKQSNQSDNKSERPKKIRMARVYKEK